MNDPGDGTYWSVVFSKLLDHKSVPELVRKPFQRGNGIGIGEAWFSYLICFSPASDLASQWEEYADHGAGCAIEFSFDALLNDETVESCTRGRQWSMTRMFSAQRP